MATRLIRYALTLLAAVAMVRGEPAVPATTPAHRLNEKWWLDRHKEKLAAAEKGGYELVFVGDSITEWWEHFGIKSWEKYYVPRKALNLGYKMDRTEHVLWRIDHGELDGLDPKVVVVLIGSNNTVHRRDGPKEIAAGVKAVVDRVRTKLPKTKVLLVAILPRGEKRTSPTRVKIAKTNELLATLADGETVFFLDVSRKFVWWWGHINRRLLPDGLHPNGNGYKAWAKAMEPTLKKLME